MKKFFLIVAAFVLVIGAGGVLFKEQLWEVAKNLITADMYVAADTDDFDPGIRVGEKFPEIAALYAGSEVQDVSRFYKDKGMIFIANRSADW